VLEPLVVVWEHRTGAWIRPKIDLVELARLRREGLTLKEAREQMGVSKTALYEARRKSTTRLKPSSFAGSPRR
jgi:predicted DNA-binding protein (UPF0251 family)